MRSCVAASRSAANVESSSVIGDGGSRRGSPSAATSATSASSAAVTVAAREELAQECGHFDRAVRQLLRDGARRIDDVRRRRPDAREQPGFAVVASGSSTVSPAASPGRAALRGGPAREPGALEEQAVVVRGSGREEDQRDAHGRQRRRQLAELGRDVHAVPARRAPVDDAPPCPPRSSLRTTTSSRSRRVNAGSAVPTGRPSGRSGCTATGAT